MTRLNNFYASIRFRVGPSDSIPGDSADSFTLESGRRTSPHLAPARLTGGRCLPPTQRDVERHQWSAVIREIGPSSGRSVISRDQPSRRCRLANRTAYKQSRDTWEGVAHNSTGCTQRPLGPSYRVM